MRWQIFPALACVIPFGLMNGHPSRALGEDPPRQEPSLTAQPAKAFAWTSEKGLRYTWVLPGTVADPGHRTLIILCHGTGLDYRWGSANYPPGVFRPADIVISVDGPSPGPNGTRLFLSEEDDSAAFAGFIGEMARVFGASRTIVYGHSQGSFFAAWFAGEHPELVDGVIAHASGVWTWTKYGRDVAGVPIVLMHGSADPVVPYGQSVGGRDWYREQGHPMVQLRRLDRYNHWPNGERAAEAIDWCIGMKTAQPAEALAAAESMVRPKGVDKYAYEAPPWFSGARDVLRRFEGRGPRPFGPEVLKGIPAAERDRAAELTKLIEAAGEAHVQKLRASIKQPEDLKLDGGAWLGHLVLVREDFRGVDSVEAYMTQIGYDGALREHVKAAAPLMDTWYEQAEPDAKFGAAVAALPRCFLIETLPFGFGDTMADWWRNADGAGITPEHRKQYANFAMWQTGWQEGRKQYKELWKAWKP